MKPLFMMLASTALTMAAHCCLAANSEARFNDPICAFDHASGICDNREIDKSADQWRAGQDLYNCLVGPEGGHMDITIPAKTKAYRLNISWGGYDKANATPTGTIDLAVDQTAHIKTTTEHAPEPGDDDKTYRWRGYLELPLSKDAHHIVVLHDTSNSNAGNTYLRIRLINTSGTPADSSSKEAKKDQSKEAMTSEAKWEGCTLKNGNATTWSKESYIYDCTGTGKAKLDFQLPAQTVAYRVDLQWGGLEKTSQGDHPDSGATFTLAVQADPLLSAVQTQGGNGHKEDWRYEGHKQYRFEPGKAVNLHVEEKVTNAHLQNIYLRILFLSSEAP